MLILNNVSKAFGDKVLFENLSLEFNTGLYLIRGNSGIGKTTLLRIIAGLDTDYDGEVIGGGLKNVSFSFQEYRLFPTLNALDNALIAFESPSDNIVDLAKGYLNALGLSDSDLLLFPSELSGGMKLKISIVRALLKDCPIILLDEPTRELDAVSAEAVVDLLCKFCEAKTVIVVSHDRLEKLEKISTVINL